MKKIVFIFIFLNFALISVFSDEDFSVHRSGYYHDDELAYGFLDREITLHKYSLKEGRSEFIKEGKYSIVSEHGVPFVNINWYDGNSDKFLLLFYGSSDRILLYKDETEPFFKGKYWDDTFGLDESGTNAHSDKLYKTTEIAASSTLNNGSVVYSSEISNLLIGKPWVEGVQGQGIGEKLTFNVSYADNLYISTGFVSYNRPNLFSQNSRPSRINISFLSNSSEDSFFVDLEDTPHFQKIELPQSISLSGNVTVQIQIYEIFAGARWPDTGVNAILYSRK